MTADERLTKLVSNRASNIRLIGTFEGTTSIVQTKFSIQAQLVSGLLAICAGSIYEGGANPFRITTITSVEQAPGFAAWTSWDDETEVVSLHRKFRRSQDFRIDQQLIRNFEEAKFPAIGLNIFQKKNRTELEDALTKAVYWYADAHTEATPVMRLIKYWSSVETFFQETPKQ